MIEEISKHSVPTLIYFDDGKGRAELTRLIFLINDFPFEDQRVSFSEYKKMRAEGLLPFDQLPVLKLESTIISQSCAIARYAAKLTNLYPKDLNNALMTDMVVDTWRDLLDLFYACYVQRVVDNGRFIMSMLTPLEKFEKIADFFNVTFPRHLKQFELMLADHSNSIYLLESLTWADLAIFDLLCTLDPSNTIWTDPNTLFYISTPGPYQPPIDLYSSYPQLQTLKTNIQENTKISQWLTTHPY